jgi:endonuclease III
MDRLAATYHGRGAVELGAPYRVLVATVISQRTREEQTAPVSERVFACYPDVASLAAADEAALYDALEGSEYREAKAPRLIALARILVERHGGRVPADLDALLALPGVGRKTANCVRIYAFDEAALCVDTHCHRITNRLGWVPHEDPGPDRAGPGSGPAPRPVGGQQSAVPPARARRLRARRPLRAAAARCGRGAATVRHRTRRNGSPAGRCGRWGRNGSRRRPSTTADRRTGAAGRTEICLCCG